MKKYLRKSLFVMAIMTSMVSATVYETGYSNGSNWGIYDSTPAGASIQRASGTKGIQLKGSGRRNGYILGNLEGRDGAWNNTTEKTIQWKMKYSDRFTIYISVQTTKGHRYIYYTNSNSNRGINGKYIHHGLGSDSADDTWKTFNINLETDLKEFEIDNNIISIDAFLVRGSGRIDDISLHK